MAMCVPQNSFQFSVFSFQFGSLDRTVTTQPSLEEETKRAKGDKRAKSVFIILPFSDCGVTPQHEAESYKSCQ
jgi:hypothetical protein